MGLLFKTIAAFAFGAVAIYGAQTLWLRTVTGYITSAGPNLGIPEMRPVVTNPNFDLAKNKSWTDALHPKIDPNLGREAAGLYIQNQVNQMMRAGQNIPRPPSIPGFRR